MRNTLLITGLAAALAATAEAHAQRAPESSYDRRSHLQLQLFGGASHGRLPGASYGIGARYFVAEGHGAMLRVERIETAQRFRLGCEGCSATSFTLFDMAYAHRWILSRHGTHQWIASLYQGISLGPRTLRDVTQRTSDEVIDAGGILGGSIDLRYGSFTVGIDLDVRLLSSFGSTRTSDDTLVTLRLRIGGDFSIRTGAPARRAPRRR